jgi:hypothetical protein
MAMSARMTLSGQSAPRGVIDRARLRLRVYETFDPERKPKLTELRKGCRGDVIGEIPIPEELNDQCR